MKLTIFKDRAKNPPDSAEARKKAFAEKVAALRAATGKAERFVMACACAIHDKPFSVLFERTDPQRPFTIAGIVKDEEGHGTGGASRPRRLDAREIDATGWRCPWCGDTSTIMQCPACRTAVCGGRVEPVPGAIGVFACRPSCGKRVTMVKAETVDGAANSPPTPAPALPRNPNRLLPKGNT